MTLDALLRTRILGISSDEATFARRGFESAADVARRRLETIGRTFIDGYHHALRDATPSSLARALDDVPHERRGFAYEGAAMGLALRDLLGRRTDRLAAFLAGPGDRHAYMVTVGAGWALARLPHRAISTVLRPRVRALLGAIDPVDRWLVHDGYGFHQGFFHWRRFLAGGERPVELAGPVARAFDQGLGRSAWFVTGASVPGVGARLAALERDRHPDLWSGVGFAVAYAGGADARALDALATCAGEHRDHLAEGAAFAATARRRARTETPHTELACAALCGVAASEAARWTDRARLDLPADDVSGAGDAAYETWRRRVRSCVRARGAA